MVAATTELETAEQALTAAADALRSVDVEGAVAHLSAAVRGFTAAGEPRRAAMACVQLGDVLTNGMGNRIAGRAWFARAARLVEGEERCVEQGWVAVAAMGCDAGDPGELLAACELALDRAREFANVNLELKALADGGLAHVQAGRIDHGMALLDEALALACGPADDVDTAGRAACSLFTACYYTGDFERAASWADLLRRAGLVGPAAGSPIFLSSHCDAVRARLLCELGRWGEAEAILVDAHAAFEAAMGSPSWHPAILLADLRICQGRHTDAELLLLGKDQALDALLPMARLHLARGDHGLAVAAARRGLRALGGDRFRAIELLTVVVDAELARGEIEAAAAACRELQDRLVEVGNPITRAKTALAHARVLAATGEPDEAVASLEQTVDGLDVHRSPWLRARLLLELAGLHDQRGDQAAAVLDAKGARAVLAGLDVVLEPDQRALLDRLAPDAGGGAPAPVASLARDHPWWTASFGATRVRLRDTKGLRYLAELLARPGVEHHALDLVDRVEGPPAAGEVERHRLGDAGELVDATARAAYRRRIEQLRADSEDALALGDLDRADALQAELDQLVSQLARAFGLGGRSRRASSAAERARVNVTRALRAAIANLEDALPGVGNALDRQVRTGMYCVYEPGEREPRWIVRS